MVSSVTMKIGLDGMSKSVTSCRDKMVSRALGSIAGGPLLATDGAAGLSTSVTGPVDSGDEDLMIFNDFGIFDFLLALGLLGTATLVFLGPIARMSDRVERGVKSRGRIRRFASLCVLFPVIHQSTKHASILPFVFSSSTYHNFSAFLCIATSNQKAYAAE